MDWKELKHVMTDTNPGAERDHGKACHDLAGALLDHCEHYEPAEAMTALLIATACVAERLGLPFEEAAIVGSAIAKRLNAAVRIEEGTN